MAWPQVKSIPIVRAATSDPWSSTCSAIDLKLRIRANLIRTVTMAEQSVPRNILRMQVPSKFW
jgi:hypothetical protein